MTGVDDGGAPREARKRRGYWIPGLIALTVLVLLALALGAGDLTHPSPRNLAGSDVEAQLSLGIQAEDGSTRPAVVHCPASEPLETGRRFACTFVDGGRNVSVSVVEVDNRGQLRWSIGTAAAQADQHPGT